MTDPNAAPQADSDQKPDEQPDAQEDRAAEADAPSDAKRRPEPDAGGLLIFGVVSLLALAMWAGLLIKSIRDIKLWWAADSVAEAPAVVLRSFVRSRQGQDHRQSTYTEHAGHVDFQYEVDGRTYTGDNDNEKTWSRMEYDAQDVVLLYPKGRKFTVYYSRKNPRETRMERPSMPRWRMVLMLIVAIVATPIPFLCIRSEVRQIARFLRKRRAARASDA